MTERFAALKASDGGFDFWRNDAPKCPHCGEDYDIAESEAWGLYSEGEHTVECPNCNTEFAVLVNVSYSFSTDIQDDQS